MPSKPPSRPTPDCFMPPNGAAALETLQVEEILNVWWEDLMPECFWEFRVKDFGPLIVAIDSHGNSLYQRIKDEAAARIKAFSFD